MASSGGASRSSNVRLILSSNSADELEKIQWLEENKSRLLAGLGVLLALALCFVLISFYSKHKTASALADLREGIAALHDGKVDSAIPLLEKANAQLGSGQEAQVARFYLSDAYARSGKIDEAKKIAISDSTQSPDTVYLSQMLLLAQGKSAEKLNDLTAARKSYEDAAALEGPFTFEALWSLARVADLVGDTNAATAAREKISTSYSSSPFADIVRQKLGK